MTVFVDSSALVKLYVAEGHHASVRRISDPMVVSALARVEVPAALWRKYRTGDIAAADAAVLSAEFASDLVGDGLPAPRFAIVSVTDEVLTEAVEAVARHSLRAYDSVQLGSALVVRRALGALDGFVAFDIALRAAASAEGLRPIPRDLHL